MANEFSLIACHECDLLHRIVHQHGQGVVKCQRCSAVLLKHKRHSLDQTVALTIAGLIFLILSNAFPILSFKYEGQVIETILFTGVRDLFDQGMWLLAGLVFLTTILGPSVQLLAMVYVFLPLKFNRIPWKLAVVFRLVYTFYPWSMLEVFMLGILVSVVKLADMATIVPGIALWSFGALIFIIAAAVSSLDPDVVWERLDRAQ